MHEELKKIISDGMNQRFEFEQKLIERALEDESYKQELINNPKAVFEKEMGQETPSELEIEVLQETANKIYLVLPENPAAGDETEEELSEEALESVAGGKVKWWTFKCGAKVKVWTKSCSASGNNLV